MGGGYHLPVCVETVVGKWGWGQQQHVKREGACSMAVPAVSTRPRTSALRMPSTHPAIGNANHR